jgi:hypothetical protein
VNKRLAPVAFTVRAEFATPAADGTRRFSGVAYAGGVITDHGWYDRVAFDLSSTKFQTPAPVLFSHTDPIGLVDTAAINGKLTVEGKLFADMDGPAKQVAAMADRGMPWQMSLCILPGRIEEFKAGQKVQLNGQTFDGPLTVFRNNRVREVSFCPLGADDQTTAQVFNIGGDEPRQQGAGMDKEFSQADLDAAVAKGIEAEKTRADKATAEHAELQAKFTATRNTQRTETVKGYFKASGREFKDELAKPYLEMTDEQFAAVGEVFAAQKPPLDPKLQEEHAKSGTGGGDGKLDTAPKIQAAAQTYMAEQFKATGREISVAEAVCFVTKKAA